MEPEERKLAEEIFIANIGEAMSKHESGTIGVADAMLTSSFAATSMVQHKPKEEGIAVAVMGAASDSARTPIPPGPSNAVGVVGVPDRAASLLSA